jgi:hypothetical protein
MSGQWSFDPKCYELAEHFIGMHAPQEFLNELAQAIQDTVEDYGYGKEEDPGIQADMATPFAENH